MFRMETKTSKMRVSRRKFQDAYSMQYAAIFWNIELLIEAFLALVTRQTFETDADIDEERTVWIEKGTPFNISEEHRVTVLGRQHEIQG